MRGESLTLFNACCFQSFGSLVGVTIAPRPDLRFASLEIRSQLIGQTILAIRVLFGFSRFFVIFSHVFVPFCPLTRQSQLAYHYGNAVSCKTPEKNMHT